MNISGEVVRTSQLPKKTLGLNDSLVALMSSPLETVTVPVSDFVSFVINQVILSGSFDSLDDLSDVTINLPSSGQLLRYDGTSWYNWTPTYYSLPSGGTSLQYIDGTGALQAFPTFSFTSTVKHSVKAGVPITKGQAVYVTGADGTNMIVGLASNTQESTSSKTMGLLESTVTTNGFANVITEGLLTGLDTTGANAAGDPVWLGTNGNLIYGLTNKPYAPAHLVFIGIVTRRNANNGEIFVKVQNGFELREIHDVDLITTTPINGHLLGFDGTLWVNKTIASWLGYTPANASGTTNYLSKFTGTTTLGNSLVYDNGTNVGIGTTSPTDRLHIVDATNANIFARVTANGTNASAAWVAQNDQVDNVVYRVFGSAVTGTQMGISLARSASLLANLGGTGSFLVGTYSNTDFILGTANTERARINTSGNFLIGTTTDSGYKLDVSGSSRVTGDITLGTGATTDNSKINIYGNNAGVSKYLRLEHTNSSTSQLVTDNTYLSLTAANYIAATKTLLAYGGVWLTKDTLIRSTESDNSYVDLMQLTSANLLKFGVITNISSNGAVAIYSNEVERVRIDSAGNVGVGTTSPAANLEIKGSAAALQITTSDYVVGTSGSRTIIGFGASTGNTYSRIQTTDVGGISASDLILQADSGNVGIGIATPVSKLQVTGGGATYGEAITWTGATDYGGTNRGYVGYDAAGATTAYIGNQFVGGDGISSKFQIRMGIDPKLTVMNGGNVGIGTTTPTARLQVEGSTNASTGVARGAYLNQTLVAQSNNDTLIGLDIASTFTTSSFTNVQQYGLRLLNTASAPAASSTNSPSLILQGSAWNSATGPTSMTGGIVVAARTYPSIGTNINPPVSKLSFLVGANSALPTEKMSIDSDGRLLTYGGFVGNAPTTNNIYNFTLDNAGSATSGSSLDSNKIVLKGRSWNSAQGSMPNIAYLMVRAVVGNANPTTDKLSFYVGTAALSNSGDTDGNATERLALRTDGIFSFFNSSVTEVLRLFNTGNLVLQNGGTFTDAGYRLDVNGTARVQGTTTIVPTADTSAIVSTGYSVTGSGTTPLVDLSGTWNTTGNVNALRINITNTASGIGSNLINLQVGGNTLFRVSSSSISGITNGGPLAANGYGLGNGSAGIFTVDGTGAYTSTGTSIKFSDGLANVGYSYIFESGQYVNKTFTSGIGGFISIKRGFAPTSGTGQLNILHLQNIINQTGGANGITRGLYVNPTLTAAADWRSIEWSNNTGWGLYGVGTALNYLGGGLVIGTTSINSSALLQVESTTKGILGPRLTTAQILAISTPAEGLYVYNTDLKTLCFYNGTAWQKVTSTAM